MKPTELRISVLRTIEEHGETKTVTELVALIDRPNCKRTYSNSVHRCVRDLLKAGMLTDEDGILKLTEPGKDMLDMAQVKEEPTPMFFVPVKPKKH